MFSECRTLFRSRNAWPTRRWRTGREQYAAEVRRLIDAAFAVMRTTGDIDPQVRDIVKAAGLSNQAFYRHFASKDALLLAVLADGQRQLVDYLRARVASTADPETQVRRWIEGVLAAGAEPRRGRSHAPVRDQRRPSRRPLPRRSRGHARRTARHARAVGRRARRHRSTTRRSSASSRSPRMNDAITQPSPPATAMRCNVSWRSASQESAHGT